MERYDFYGMIICAFRGKSRSHNMKQSISSRGVGRPYHAMSRRRRCHVIEKTTLGVCIRYGAYSRENTLEYFLRSPGHLLCHLQCVTQHPSIDSLWERFVYRAKII